jgi:hypothetical protein
MLTSSHPARLPARERRLHGRTIAGRWLLIAAVALVAGPALSWAQGIDVEVTGV